MCHPLKGRGGFSSLASGIVDWQNVFKVCRAEEMGGYLCDESDPWL